MQFCKGHWEELREEVKRLGIWSLVATSGEQAAAQMVGQIEGKPERSTYDPLMACHNMIFSKALDMVGLELMRDDDDGTPRCPICFLQRCHDEQGKCVEADCLWNEPSRVHSFWIEGPAAAARSEAVRLGLMAST